MGLNQTAIATVIALLGAAPLLHAETAAQPATPAAETTTVVQEPATAPAPVTDSTPAQTTVPAVAEEPALNASPIMGTESAAQPAAPPEATAPVQTKGDVLTLPAKPSIAKKRAPSAPINIEEDGMPGRGASMAQVEKHFGAPREKLAPVGDPPITRWFYGDYTVYFEHQYVIHSVRNPGGVAPEPATPATAAPTPTEAAPASGQ